MPRSRPRERHELYQVEEQTKFGQSDNYDNIVGSRSTTPRPGLLRGAQTETAPHPLSQLSPELATFCAYGSQAYASIVTYVDKHRDIWSDETRSQLQNVARQLLLRNDEIGALQVVSRLLMLELSAKESDRVVPRIKWLAALKTDNRHREWFEGLCNDYLSQLRSKAVQTVAERPAAAPAPQRIQPLGADVLQESTDPRLRSLSLSSGNKPRRGPSEKGSGSVDNNVSVISDLDSIEGGPAFVGASGPESDIVAELPRKAQEQLHRDYKVHMGRDPINRVFGQGSVIAVFWHENKGTSIAEHYRKVPKATESMNPGKGFFTRGPKGELIYSHVRRFVIVKQRRGHSIGVPITSYSNKGLTKKDFSDPERRAHAIVFTLGSGPQQLADEPKFSKDPICVDFRSSGETLSATSRLYYAKPQSIDHNIKVKHLGHVVDQYLPRFLAAFRTEMSLD